MTKSPWDEYLATAHEQYEAIEQGERYKFALAEALAKARNALLKDEPDWLDLVVAAVGHKRNNLIYWLNVNKFKKCIANHPDEVREALQEIWAEEDRTPGDRIRAFDSRLSESMLDIPPTATGSRLAIASYLMMGIDAQQYPPFRRDTFRITYTKLGYPQASANDAGVWYEHALGFLDRVLQEVKQREMDAPNNRLDAQSVVWALDKWVRNKGKPTPGTPPPNPPESMHPLNTILYGPPGTGKTWHTVTRAVAIIEGRNVDGVEQENRDEVKGRFEKYRDAKQVEMVTFHQNATYEDFIEGIRPVLTTDQTSTNGQASPEPGSPGDIQYEMRQGVFRRIAERAQQGPDQRYVLVIDEINRGNIARIFGELITLIEDSKRTGKHDEASVTLPGSKTKFSVPSNLYLLGTMNTADRSIALLDTALRRRFKFREMMPNPSHEGVNENVDGANCGELLKAMNQRIAVLLDRDHQIGHTYFLGVNDMEALADAFQHGVMPLLQEYFYEDWEKIRAALNNNGFIRRSEPPAELVRLELAESGRTVYDLLPADNERWTDPAAYRAIYETETAGTEETPNDSAARMPNDSPAGTNDDSVAGTNDDSAAEDE